MMNYWDLVLPFINANLKNQIKFLILSKDIASETKNIEKNIKKQFMTLKCSKILRTKDIPLFDFPDNRFDSIDLLDIVNVIETEIDSFKLI